MVPRLTPSVTLGNTYDIDIYCGIIEIRVGKI